MVTLIGLNTKIVLVCFTCLFLNWYLVSDVDASDVHGSHMEDILAFEFVQKMDSNENILNKQII